jgi:hypothetical protein
MDALSVETWELPMSYVSEQCTESGEALEQIREVNLAYLLLVQRLARTGKVSRLLTTPYQGD